MMSPRDAAQFFADGCDHVETMTELESRLSRGEPLVVKFGIDPTGSDLHLGHGVVLHKLQQFVELGHHVVLLIGDFTARIGDPTGRNEQRPHLRPEQIEANMSNYAAQAGRVLDLERVSVRYNSQWLSTIDLEQLIGLLAQTTVAQMLERNDFRKRFDSGVPISLHEFLYPVAQAYDSVALHSDVELGGSEQLFNLLIARGYQTRAGQPAQICMTLPILEGTDGVARMGKSMGNYIGIAEHAEQQFGKLMSIPDSLIPRYARLAAFRSAEDVGRLERALSSGSASPMDEKKRLACEVVALYHGPQRAGAAREYFERTVQRKEAPAEIGDFPLGEARKVADVLVRSAFAESKRAAERLIAGGGVRVDGTVVSDPSAAWVWETPAVLSVGSRRFIRVLPNER